MSDRTRSTALYAGLFLVSAAILHLEILQTRIFSVMLWHHVTYLVVTFTLLGFAAAGAFVAIRPSLLQGDFAGRLTLFAGLFGLSTVGAFWLLGTIRLDTVDLLQNRLQYFILFIYYLYLLVPYFFGGLVIVLLITKLSRRVNRVYFINLAGSGVGCLVFFPVLPMAEGEGSILVAAAIASAGALCFATAAHHRKAWSITALFLFAASCVGVPFARDWLTIRPAPSKMIHHLLENRGGILEQTVWDPLCRVDVVKLPFSERRILLQDGDAPTSIRPWKPGAESMLYRSPLYEIHDSPSVMVIGVGGGGDVIQALENGASSVIGVEVNPSIHALMSGPYAELTGRLYTRSDASIKVAEGRSHLRRSEERFQIIQMTGTDTYAALSSGSFIFSESYLYTVEAFEDYLDHLTEDGVISVLRFRFHPPRESLKLVAMGAEALKRRGVARPSRHIVVITYRKPTMHQTMELTYACMLFKKTPFTPEEVALFEEFLKTRPGDTFSLSYDAAGKGEAEFVQLLEAADKGEEEAFYRDYPYDIEPVTDNRPFFFSYHKWSDLFQRLRSPNIHGLIGEDPVGLFILVSVLLDTIVLSILLVALPLFVFRRKGLNVPFKGRILFYFLALGGSYLFIEIAFMQRFTLFLGHPTYSLSIVLFTFLVFSGVGSLFSRRFFRAPSKGIALAMTMIAALLLLFLFLLPPLFHSCLALKEPMRIGITVALLAPLAFFMGMPFPLGMRVLHARAQQAIPWAFGINGIASVVGSVICIVIAMGAGFTFVLLLAGLLYLAAWFIFRPVCPS